MVRQRRRVSFGATLVVALVGALAARAPYAAADTGGHTLTYTTGYHAFVATAAHPLHRLRLPHPRVPGADSVSTIQQIVPSPDGRRLAQAFDFFVETPHHLDLYTAVVVTDRRGGHQHLVWRQPRRSGIRETLVQGMSWSADGRRLYFAPRERSPRTGHMTTNLLTSRIRASSVGPVSHVSGGSGLAWPTADPTGGALAAVRTQPGSCRNPGGDVTATPRHATVVLLHPRTGRQHDLTTVTTPPATCAAPIEYLAWSPDGRRIAFDTDWTRPNGRETADVRVLAADGSDVTSVIVVSGDGRHIAMSPAWQSARSLWFAWKPIMNDRFDSTSNFYSTELAHGAFQPMVRRTHIVRYGRRVFDPSFG